MYEEPLDFQCQYKGNTEKFQQQIYCKYVGYVGFDWCLLWQDSVKFGKSTTELHYQNKNGIKILINTSTRCSVNFSLSTC